MTIGERIKERRLEINMTVDELASKLSKNRATVYRYESNDIENLPVTTLGPLSEALRTTPAYLMGWEIQEPSSLSPDELNIINLYRNLNTDGRQRARQALEDLCDISRYTEPTPEVSEKHFA